MLQGAKEQRKPLRLEIYNYPAGLWENSKKEPTCKIINGSQEMPGQLNTCSNMSQSIKP